VTSLGAALTAAGHEVDLRTGEDIVSLTDEQAERPRFVFFYAVDAAHPWLEVKESPLAKSGLDRLRSLLKNGPGARIHTIGWWRGVARLKDTLGFGGTDDVGAWIALDVQGSELNTLAAGQIIDWSPRPHRAVFFDRTTHSRPEVVIPFDTSTALGTP
jgi:hypothetical protein